MQKRQKKAATKRGGNHPKRDQGNSVKRNMVVENTNMNISRAERSGININPHRTKNKNTPISSGIENRKKQANKKQAQIKSQIPELDKAKQGIFVMRGKIDVIFCLLVVALLVFGLMMLFSASYARAFQDNNGDSYFYIKKQALFATMGLFIMYVASRANYKIFQVFSIPIWLVSLGLVLITQVMPERGGARRWIFIGDSFSFQPSEIVKIAIIFIFAHLIAINYDKMKDPKVGIIPFLVILGITCVSVIIQPHVSGTIIIAAIGAIMMFIGGSSLKYLFGIGGVFLGAILVVIFAIPNLFSHAQTRLEFWFDPWADPLGYGYQSIQSLLAIGSGGVMGVGLGESRQKYMYLPEVQNDFVFAIVCEELGLVGASLVIILFALLVWRGFTIAMRSKDKFGSMMAVGLTAQVGIQALLNIAVVTNTIPNTGISLPFFSYGGTSLIIMLGQMGLILSVSRQIHYTKE